MRKGLEEIKKKLKKVKEWEARWREEKKRMEKHIK